MMTARQQSAFETTQRRSRQSNKASQEKTWQNYINQNHFLENDLKISWVTNSSPLKHLTKNKSKAT